MSNNSRVGKQIECLFRLDQLIASNDSIAEFLRAEDLLSKEEVKGIKSASDTAKALQGHLSRLSSSNKLQLLEYEWTLLPVERLKITIVTDRNSMEFSYNY